MGSMVERRRCLERQRRRRVREGDGLNRYGAVDGAVWMMGELASGAEGRLP
jgi:hypothetical protein